MHNKNNTQLTQAYNVMRELYQQHDNCKIR